MERTMENIPARQLSLESLLSTFNTAEFGKSTCGTHKRHIEKSSNLVAGTVPVLLYKSI